jgi:hypothetical protein
LFYNNLFNAFFNAAHYFIFPKMFDSRDAILKNLRQFCQFNPIRHRMVQKWRTMI